MILQPAGAAHRINPLGKKPPGDDALPFSLAIKHGNIRILDSQINPLIRGQNAQINLRVTLRKPLQPWHQPVIGKGHRSGDSDLGHPDRCPQFTHRAPDFVQPARHRIKKLTAFSGQFNGTMFAQEERAAKLRLQRFHLPADRTLRQA